MQQVITISSRYDVIEQGKDFKETEYPVLKSYLEKGYTVSQVIPIIKTASDTSFRYAVVFVLDKFESGF